MPFATSDIIIRISHSYRATDDLLMVDKFHSIKCIIFIREHTAASGQGTVRFAPLLCMYYYMIVWGSTVCSKGMSG